MTCQSSIGPISKTVTITSSAPPPPPPPPPPGPSVTLKANGQDVLQTTGTYTLSWNSSNVTGPTCTISYSSTGGETGNFAVNANASGSAQTGLIGTYTMTCESSQGPLSKTVTITSSTPPPPPPPPPGPSVTLKANGEDALVTNGTYTLSWSSSNVTGPTCTISYSSIGGEVGNFPVNANASGSAQTGLIGVYTMTCESSQGPISKTVTITSSAPPPPSVTMYIADNRDAIALPLGAEYTITYASANATSCTMSYSINGGPPVVGTPAPNTSGTSIGTVPQGGIVHTFACSNANGSTTKTVRVTVAETSSLPPSFSQFPFGFAKDKQLAFALAALERALKSILQLLRQ